MNSMNNEKIRITKESSKKTVIGLRNITGFELKTDDDYFVHIPSFYRETKDNEKWGKPMLTWSTYFKRVSTKELILYKEKKYRNTDITKKNFSVDMCTLIKKKSNRDDTYVHPELFISFIQEILPKFGDFYWSIIIEHLKGETLKRTRKRTKSSDLDETCVSEEDTSSEESDSSQEEIKEGFDDLRIDDDRSESE